MVREIVGICLAGCCSALFAETFTVPAGETFELNVYDSVITNKADNIIELNEGATLKLVQAVPGGGFALYEMLNAPVATDDAWSTFAAKGSGAFANEMWYWGMRSDVTWSSLNKAQLGNYVVLYRATWHVPADATYGFYLNVDDWGQIEIDGSIVLSQTAACKTVATNGVALTAGDHVLNIVLANMSGNFGYVKNVGAPAVAYSATNELLTQETAAANGTPFADPGDGSVLTPLPLDIPPSVQPNVRVRGAATLDATALGLDTVRWTGALRTDGNQLSVTGTKGVVFGARDMSNTIDYPLYDIPNLSFAAADATGVVLTNQVTVMALPSCDVALAPGLMAALRGTNTFERFYVDGALDLADWDVTLLEPLAAHGAPIRVHGGRTLIYKPCGWADNDMRDWNWRGCGGGAYTNTITLLSDAHGDAVLKSLALQHFNLYCTLSGTGLVVQACTANWTNPQFHLYGSCTQTGTVKVVDGTGSLIFHPPVNPATPGHSTNPVDLNAGAIFACHTWGTEPEPPCTYLESVTGKIDAKGNIAQISSMPLETVTIGSLYGNVRFVRGVSGGDYFSSQFVVTNNYSNGFLINGGERVRVVNVSNSDAAVRALVTETKTTSVLGCEDAEHAWRHFNIDAGATLQFEGTGVVSWVTGTGSLKLALGAKLTVDQVDPSVAIDASQGELVISSGAQNWKNKVLLWLDATAADTLHQLTSNTNEGLTWTNDFKLIDAWYDRRAEQREVFALNNRLWTMGKYDLNPQAYPYLVPTGGPNGLPCLSFGTCQKTVKGGGPNGSDATEARRLQFWRGDIVTTGGGDRMLDDYAKLDVKWAMLVVGSAWGGGNGLLGTDANIFERTGRTLDQPLAKLDFPLYLDGALDSTTNAYFSGGWQLCSFAVNRTDVNGIAMSYNHTTAGGQDLAEVILFSAEPTGAERVACEGYLAKKWGVAKQAYPDGASLQLGGSGTVSVASGAETVLQGAFSGEVALDGGTVEFAGRLPIDESGVPADGRVGWYDPQLEGAIGLSVSTVTDRPLALRYVAGRDNAGVITGTGATYLLGTYNLKDYDRRPWLSVGSRGGAAENWIDFSNTYGETQGNTLRRFEGAPPTGESGNTTAQSVNVRTAFVALDSVNGGGMPLIDTVGANTLIKKRTPTQDISTPIWAADTSVDVTGGVTRLDGQIVDGVKSGYTGRPEVLSLETKANVPLMYFGWYGNDWKTTPNVEVLGEILLYNKLLTAEERLDIEAYLMGKWTGRLPFGYGDFTRATVRGSGTVKAQNTAVLPTFADGFTGTVDLAQTEFACTLDRNVVTGATTVPCTLALPAACRMTVTCTTKPQPGLYTLIDSTGFTGGTTWTLVLAGEFGGAQCHLQAVNGRLMLEVIGKGTMVLVR